MKTPLFITLLLGLAAISTVLPKPAEAARAPDYKRYCNTYHSGSFVNSFRSTGEPICSKRTSRLSLMHYRIQVAEACRLTTGSRAFKRTGRGKYTCLGGGKKTVVQFQGVKPNYSKYCRTYHSGSFVNTLRTTKEKICTVRTSRYRMVHHKINLANACRLTTGKTTFRRYGPGVVRCRR